jgi:uncharacterized protein
MELHNQIKGELKTAMKAHDAVKLRTVRSMLTAFTNELVATGKKPQDTLDDAGVLSVIKRLAKQRKESIVQFEAGKREDLAQPEREELIVLESYLPKTMSQEEIRPIAEKKLGELNITDKTKIGMAIGAVMKELQGKADGADVKAVVEEILK